MSGESRERYQKIAKGVAICAIEFLVPILLISMALARSAHAQESEQTLCCDFVLGVPQPSEGNQSRARHFRGDSVLFYLKAFLPAHPELTWSDENHVQIPVGVLPPDVHRIFQNSLDENGDLSPHSFRESIAEPYRRERALRHGDFVIPDDLSELVRARDFLSWRREVVALSGVKGRTRALYYSPTGVLPRMAVAQTHDSTSGDTATPVRETELIVERLNEADQWDFYAYDATGRASIESEFRSGPQPVPAVCLGCHYSSVTRSFTTRGSGFEN